MESTGHAAMGSGNMSGGDGVHSWRDTLPVSMVSKSDLSVWSVLKKCIGKDLTRISVPVVFNEPLSFLQRLAEYMEYAELLERASKCADVTERFEYVAAFIVSSLSCNYMRLSKPFNPLWFETYELDRSDKNGYRFIAEQVSHHPPKSAFHAESKSYEFDGVVSPRLKFWGTSIEVQPSGSFRLKFLNHNETYTWKTLNVTIHNIVMGQMYIQLTFVFGNDYLYTSTKFKKSFLEGNLLIQCNTGFECKLSFKNNDNGPSRQSTFFQGCISKEKSNLRAIYGNWTTFLATCEITNFEFRYDDWLGIGKQFFQNCSAMVGFIFYSIYHFVFVCTYVFETNLISFYWKLLQEDIPLIQRSKLIWKSRPRPLNSSSMYNFTSFTFLLNDPSDITSLLPPTDSRRRPDIRLLETGQAEAAEKEKERLEVKQRQARALMKKTKEKLPRWFEKITSKDHLLWMFTYKYWDREYCDCEDIY
uniref:Oxysterol-binding protein n=1 Tax=Wuchereria bancrofti TaxID=6293 RepID=A0A1I8EH19_WUCBA